MADFEAVVAVTIVLQYSVVPRRFSCQPLFPRLTLNIRFVYSKSKTDQAKCEIIG